jgi:hypothetical protein
MVRKTYGKSPWRDRASTFSTDVDDGHESKLQAKIEKWCDTWGHPKLSFRQSPKIKTILPPGMPDLVIFLPKGRVLCLELKSRSGRLSDAQKQMKLQFMHHGHDIIEVRSFRSFLKIIESP